MRENLRHDIETMTEPTVQGSGVALWEQYRDQFPVREQLIYLNHAGVTPLCRRSAEAMTLLAQDVMGFGSHHYHQWAEVYDGLRRAAARLVGGDASDIALVKNTSEGIAMVATGFDWRAGDQVVAFEEEFPANYYPWKRLEQRGVRVAWLSVFDPLEKIDAACAGARMLAVSFVQYLSGYRVDLGVLGEICRRRGCFFFVDAIQGLGAFPVDVRRCGIHALAADGHKWLLGPEGCGILYIDPELRERVEPVEFGYTNVARYADYGTRDMTLRPDAGRYECGTLNTIGCYGLKAAIEFVLEVGVERIRVAVQALGDRIATGVAAKGYEVLGRRSAATGAGIVSFRKPGVPSGAIVHELKQQRIEAANRSGWVRTSPHFYVSGEEIEQTVATLP
jgi:cysteine desulfurase/selenocysteine lyase